MCKRDFLYTKSQGQKKSKGNTIKFKTGQRIYLLCSLQKFPYSPRRDWGFAHNVGGLKKQKQL